MEVAEGLRSTEDHMTWDMAEALLILSPWLFLYIAIHFI